MKLHKTKTLVLFSLPAFILYFVFMVLPAISAFIYSFTDWNALYKDFSFVGFDNYVEAFFDRNFIGTLSLSFRYVITMVLIQNALGLTIAVLIDSMKRQSIWRTLVFIPNMISLITSAFIWKFIYTKVFPEISAITGIGIFGESWLGDATLAFWAVTIVSVWVGVGYTMIIYLAALQNVPVVLKEAAIIDGASNLQTFINITYAITINVFLTLNGSFKAFDQFLGLTGGGPGRSTQVITLNIYNEAFAGNFRFGYGNAKAVILFLIVLIITLIQFRVMRTENS
ncbi:MAG: sugar ABC transporter permease [Spirochaetes bacterium]|jgi:raffinose/stachyose/melibiose transport system permease protein|nr:sugar ABC transporter permease [Spirochaetota bacterium]